MIPGLSGGSLAIMLGVYEEMLECAAHIRSKKNIITLGMLAIGGGTGLFISTKILEYISVNVYFGYVVMGIVVAIILYYFTKLKKQSIIFVIIGALMAYGISKISAESLDFSRFSSILILFGIEFLLALGLILPGISFSLLLVTFKLYDKIILAVNERDIVFLAIFGLMLLFWVFLSSKSLSYVFNKHPHKTNGFILGFLVFSLTDLKYDFSLGNLPLGIPMFVIGLVVSIFILVMTAKKEKKEEVVTLEPSQNTL